MSNQPDVQIENNQKASRWEAHVGPHTAIAEYQRNGETLMFTHTEVPSQVEGQGIGSQLIKAALDDARAHGQNIIPLCPFVAAYIKRHHEYADLVRPDFQHMVQR